MSDVPSYSRLKSKFIIGLFGIAMWFAWSEMVSSATSLDRDSLSAEEQQIFDEFGSEAVRMQRLADMKARHGSAMQEAYMQNMSQQLPPMSPEMMEQVLMYGR